MNGNVVNTETSWIVDSVKRKGDSLKDFIVTYTNKDMKKYEYENGDLVTIFVYTYEDYFEPMEVKINVVVKKLALFSTTSFEIVE